MASLNKVQLIGFVGKDPEVKTFPDKNIVVRFNLATTEVFIDRDGKKTELTQWHKCAISGAVAKFVKDRVKKGYQLYVEGKMKTRSFEDNETKKIIYVTEVVVSGNDSAVKILGSKDTDSDPENQV